jgi:DNA-binding LacI/PurR family transcriptional regulator
VVTIEDVARRAGVSIATVSRVLSPGTQPHPVSHATAERVRTAAYELHFVPSAIAQGLVVRRSGLLGLLVPDLNDPYYPHIASGVERSASAAQLSVLICNTLGEETHFRDYLRLLRARRVDAMIVSGGSTLSFRELRMLDEVDVPAILIGRPNQTTELPYVSIDNVSAARAATRHLLDVGRTRLAHLAGPVLQSTMHDRLEGFVATVEESSAQGEVLESSGSIESGYATMRERLARRGPRPDGVFGATDRLAIAAMAAIHDARLRVPADVAVIGFDDISLAAMLRPSLSSMAQPAAELGAKAIELVLRVAAGEKVEPITLQAKPAFRASTQA